MKVIIIVYGEGEYKEDTLSSRIVETRIETMIKEFELNDVTVDFRNSDKRCDGMMVGIELEQDTKSMLHAIGSILKAMKQLDDDIIPDYYPHDAYSSLEDKICELTEDIKSSIAQDCIPDTNIREWAQKVYKEDEELFNAIRKGNEKEVKE